MSNPFDTALVRTGARLLTGGTADVSVEELTDAWRSVWTGPPEQLDRITDAHLAADHAGTDLRTLSPWQTDCPAWPTPSSTPTQICCARRSAPAPRPPPRC